MRLLFVTSDTQHPLMVALASLGHEAVVHASPEAAAVAMDRVPVDVRDDAPAPAVTAA